MTATPAAREADEAVVITPPGAWARWWLLGAGWACFFASLALPTASRNGFMRWQYVATGAEFHQWLIADLPRWVAHWVGRGEWGYTPPMDLAWLAAVLAATGLFLASPLVFARMRRPATVLVVRYLALALLTLPATAAMPPGLRFPAPLAGMWVLAAGHALVLVGLWCPWPVLKRPGPRFEVQTAGATAMTPTMRG